jgi:allantoate deiminase
VPTSADITHRAKEAIARCQTLARFSEDTGSTRRTFLSPPMRDCHREIAGWLEPLGAKVSIDAAGNFRALYPAAQAGAPRLLLGSHLDTVPNAGAYDGVLGVVLAVILLECLGGKKLPFAIEVVGFSEEEGVRFGTPFIGSRALAGRLDDELLDRQDRHEISVRQAITEFGLDPSKIADARLPDDTLGYIEFHIEQGPVLEKLGKPLAAVEAIVGQSRLELTFVGRSNHAGTTPMDLRHDALAGAAEWITVAEQTAHEIPGTAATVGRIDAKPGAANVIPGEATLTLDVRHKSDATRARVVEDLLQQAHAIARRRGLALKINTILNQHAVPMDSFLIRQIEAAIEKTGCAPHLMASGAGHDAMVLAERVPSGMIFLRTPGGISHHPAESVEVEDVAQAIECGMYLLDRLAASTEFQTRTQRAQSR